MTFLLRLLLVIAVIPFVIVWYFIYCDIITVDYNFDQLSCNELHPCRLHSLCSVLTCTVQSLSQAQLSTHSALVSVLVPFNSPVLFLMIQRFVSQFEVVITSTLRTGHAVLLVVSNTELLHWSSWDN